GAARGAGRPLTGGPTLRRARGAGNAETPNAEGVLALVRGRRKDLRPSVPRAFRARPNRGAAGRVKGSGRVRTLKPNAARPAAGRAPRPRAPHEGRRRALRPAITRTSRCRREAARGREIRAVAAPDSRSDAMVRPACLPP